MTTSMMRFIETQILRLVCGWCGAVLREGPAPISHGMCADCQRKLQEEMDIHELARKYGSWR